MELKSTEINSSTYENSVHYLKVAFPSNEENLLHEKICKDNLLTIWRKQSEFLTLFSFNPHLFYMKRRFQFFKMQTKSTVFIIACFSQTRNRESFPKHQNET